jgi:hypothetical protein
MDDVGNAQHRLSTRETIAKARVHLLENPTVTLRLAFAAHYGKLSGRVTWCRRPRSFLPVSRNIMNPIPS